MDLELEQAVRTALFDHLTRLIERSPDGNLPAGVIREFPFRGEPIALRSQQGIVKPRQLEAALTITTSYTPPGQRPPYLDEVGFDGYPRYAYQSVRGRHDPDLYTNRAMRAAMAHALPIVYFVGVGHGRYHAAFPVFVIRDDPAAGVVTLGASAAEIGADPGATREITRRYGLHETLRRLHQAPFREQVMAAYSTSCAVCHLKHGRLLDAAHIIPDRVIGGEPVVSNGLALCKIHHAAYDGNLLGITPDAEVRINRDLLDEVDGPMLRHGLQEMHGQRILVPRQRVNRPDPERLAVRYEEFQRAS